MPFGRTCDGDDDDIGGDDDDNDGNDEDDDTEAGDSFCAQELLIHIVYMSC